VTPAQLSTAVKLADSAKEAFEAAKSAGKTLQQAAQASAMELKKTGSSAESVGEV
jgi:hypothetical protein